MNCASASGTSIFRSDDPGARVSAFTTLPSFAYLPWGRITRAEWDWS
jgi:hypothetical protein